MNYGLHDFLGNIGVALILLSFLLVQLEKMSATGVSYLLANSIGAVFILASLSQEFNLSAAIIECVWLLISLFGLARKYLRRRIRD